MTSQTRSPKVLGPFLNLVIMLLLLVLISNAQAQSGYLRNESNSNPLDSNAKKIIVLIHGWNPDDVSNSYASEPWSSLIDDVNSKIRGSTWQLFTFHWEQETLLGANTGPVYDWELLGFDLVGVGNAVKAGVNADQQGHNLASIIGSAAPNLRRVHLIAHSAGAWIAREAAADLLRSNPYINIQITLLDPFIPDVILSVRTMFDGEGFEEADGKGFWSFRE